MKYANLFFIITYILIAIITDSNLSFHAFSGIWEECNLVKYIIRSEKRGISKKIYLVKAGD